MLIVNRGAGQKQMKAESKEDNETTIQNLTRKWRGFKFSSFSLDVLGISFSPFSGNPCTQWQEWHSRVACF